MAYTFARLVVVALELPPIRDRRPDNDLAITAREVGGAGRIGRINKIYRGRQRSEATLPESAIVERNIKKVRQFIDARDPIDADTAMVCLSDDIV